MGQRKVRFKVTKKGKIVFAILFTTLISLIVIFFGMYPGVLFTHSNASINLGTNTVAEDEGQVDKTADRVDFEDNNLASIIRRNKPVSSTKTNTNTKTNTASNGNKNTVPEIDEEFFKKALFIGDSITEGISAYGLLDEINVLAVKGCTILKAEKEIDTIVKRNPEKIYILLGSNDLLYGMDSEKFSSQYAEFIHLIKDKLPSSTIYIESIFPVTRDVENKRPMLSNSRINEFNKGLKGMAEQEGVSYINISQILKDDNGILNNDYSSDGIHVKYKVYSIWLDCVKRNS